MDVRAPDCKMLTEALIRSNTNDRPARRPARHNATVFDWSVIKCSSVSEMSLGASHENNMRRLEDEGKKTHVSAIQALGRYQEISS